MKKRKIFLYLFLLLSLINAVIFWQRHHFAYQPYTTAASLHQPCDNACINKWKQFERDFPAEQTAEAKKILNDSVLLKQLSTREKILGIGNFLYTRFGARAGKPLEIANTPFNFYKKITTDTSLKLWCGDYAMLFAWFCWSEGITCRIIEIAKPGDQHVLNECYLPETGRWAMVDITHNLLLIEEQPSQPLDLLSVIEKMRTGSLLIHRSVDRQLIRDTLRLHQFQGERYYQPQYRQQYYFSLEHEDLYSTANRIKRYVLPVSWYLIYDPAQKKKTNFPYFVKLFFICLWIVTLVTLCLPVFMPRK